MIYFTSFVQFSKGYCHIELNEAMSFLTFNTCFGRFIFPRIPFGSTVAGDAFQCKPDADFHNINFCTGIAVHIWMT